MHSPQLCDAQDPLHARAGTVFLHPGNPSTILCLRLGTVGSVRSSYPLLHNGQGESSPLREAYHHYIIRPALGLPHLQDGCWLRGMDHRHLNHHDVECQQVLTFCLRRARRAYATQQAHQRAGQIANLENSLILQVPSLLPIPPLLSHRHSLPLQVLPRLHLTNSPVHEYPFSLETRFPWYRILPYPRAFLCDEHALFPPRHHEGSCLRHQRILAHRNILFLLRVDPPI